MPVPRVETDNNNYYTHMAPGEYARMVRDVVNRGYISDIRSAFEHAGSLIPHRRALPKGVTIVAAGSDGKLERHIQSRSEFVWLDNRHGVTEDAIQEEIGDFIRRHDAHNTTVFARSYETRRGPFEVKLLHDAEAPHLSYAYGDSKDVYPDRILNTVLIYGDPQVQTEARRRVLEELMEGDGENRIVRKMRDQIDASTKALRTGVVRGIKVFEVDGPSTPTNPETGRQYYNESTEHAEGEPSPYAVGFKFPALRAIQRTLDILTVRALINGKLDPNEAADATPGTKTGLPTNTLDRIKYFRARGILPPIAGDGEPDITEAYAWFLQQYHRAQEAYKDAADAYYQGLRKEAATRRARGQTTEPYPEHYPNTVAVPFSTEDFLKYQRVIMAFTEHAKGPIKEAYQPRAGLRR